MSSVDAPYTPRNISLTRRIRLCIKRLIDLVGAVAGLILLSPVLLWAMIAVRRQMGSPIFFTQERPGLHANPFHVLKLRTMTNERDASGKLLPDADRLLPLGRTLRRFSIDELPQLWNVLKGEMSLVGPRPLLMEYLERYTPEQARRHEMRPGMTGLAQIKGRNSLLFSERLRYDQAYVDNWGLWLDMKIIFLSFYLVFFARLEDGAGQHVSVVDDLGLHSETIAMRSKPASPND